LFVKLRTYNSVIYGNKNIGFQNLVHLNKESHFAAALWFFIYEFPKVMLLLVLIIFIVGILRKYFTPERTRKALEVKKTFTGNIMDTSLRILWQN
jgi:uncharacterized membrane protein YraQ (UPF0718 family)